MKQQQAFAGSEKMLKGGLHCHTTRSDGRGTPEEVIREFNLQKPRFAEMCRKGLFS